MKKQISSICLVVTLLGFSSAHAISYNYTNVTIENFSIILGSDISGITWNDQTNQSWISDDPPTPFYEYDTTINSWGNTSVSYSEDHRYANAHTSTNLNDYLYAESYQESGYYLGDNLKANSDLFSEFTVTGQGDITFQIDYTMNFNMFNEGDYNGIYNLAMVDILAGELDHYNPDSWPDLIDPMYINDTQQRVVAASDISLLNETYSGSLSVTSFFTTNQTVFFSINANAIVGGQPTAPVPEPATMLLFGTGLAGLAGYRKRKAMKK